VWGYATSYLLSAGISALALPCLVLSRRQQAGADIPEELESVVSPAAGVS
jgi:hypothetical protein